MPTNQLKFTRVQIETKLPETLAYWRRPRRSDGLLFQSTEDSTPDPVKIVSDPTIQKMLGSLYVIQDEGNGLAIHNDLLAVPPPDKATNSDVVHYWSDNKLKSLPVLQRFRQCTDPTRDLLGCSHCSNKGLPCLTGVAHGEENAFENCDGVGLDDSVLQDNKTVVAGFRYVSPVLLAEEGETFVRGRRSPSSVTWDAEETRRSLRSAASEKASLTRHFKKTECAVCPAKAGGCKRWDVCAGAYPNEDRLQEAALQEWLPFLERTPGVTGLQPWQLYAVMRLAGEPGECRWDRRHVLLGGLIREGQVLTVRVAATQRPADECYRVTNDWARLRKLFPALPEKEGGPLTERPSDKDLAFYLAAVDLNRFAPVLRGFQGYQSDYIGHISIQPHGGIWVERARRWGIRVGSGGYGGESVKSWPEFYATFGTLPAKRQRTRPEMYDY